MDIYNCELCNFKTKYLSNYKKHCNTSKHNKLHNNEYTCNICNKLYYNRSSLWYHYRICKSELEKINEQISSIKQTITTNQEQMTSIKETITSNQEEMSSIKETITTNTDELKHEIHEVKTAVEKVNPIHNHFNLNIFLNEKCKDALNWDDFVKTLQITFNMDTSMTENISRMICNGINELGIYDRPIHCTDAKRKKLYIKNNNTWNKDETTIPKTASKLQHKFNELINEWEIKNPNWREDEDKMMEYVQLMNKLGEEINYHKCKNQIVKTTVIPKDYSNDLTLES